MASFLLGQSPSRTCTRTGLWAGKGPRRPRVLAGARGLHPSGQPRPEPRAQDGERVGPGRGRSGPACTWSEGHRAGAYGAPVPRWGPAGAACSRAGRPLCGGRRSPAPGPVSRQRLRSRGLLSVPTQSTATFPRPPSARLLMERAAGRTHLRWDVGAAGAQNRGGISATWPTLPLTSPAQKWCDAHSSQRWLLVELRILCGSLVL